MFYLLYIILGTIVSWYTWTKFYCNLKNFISSDDFEATQILFFLFGIFVLWPVYLFDFVRQNKL